jgi:hypothetical protein
MRVCSREVTTGEIIVQHRDSKVADIVDQETLLALTVYQKRHERQDDIKLQPVIVFTNQ